MKITVIGSGYVGLVSGACLAELGNDVVCLDVDPRKIEILKQGGVPIYEPGLETLIKSNVAAGRLRFTTDVAESVAHGMVQMIAVGTPSGEDGSADLQYVINAARNIGRSMTEYKVIVDKSTVPVGTADKVKQAVQEELDRRASSSSPVSPPDKGGVGGWGGREGLVFPWSPTQSSSKKARPSKTSTAPTAS